MSRATEGDPRSDLARRLVHRRDELGLTRDELARRAGVRSDYLAYFEQSPSATPSASTMLQLAKALETTPEVLAGGGITRPPGSGPAGPNPLLEALDGMQCEAHLALGGVGRVVFCDPPAPLALPVNFAWLEGGVVFRTSQATSFRVVDAGLVSFEVDHIDEAMCEGWSVVVTGRGRVVTDPEQLKRLEALAIEPWAGGERDVFVRIDRTGISGRAIRRVG